MIAVKERVDARDILESRINVQNARNSYMSHLWSVEAHAKFLQSDEEGSKPILKRFHAALRDLRSLCNQFSDTHLNQSEISAAVRKVKGTTEELSVLDDRLTWTVTNLVNICDAYMVVLAQQIAISEAPQTTPIPANAQRVALTEECDGLTALLMCIGDREHGGLAERRLCVERVGDLRKMITADFSSPLKDTKELIGQLRRIEVQVALLMGLRDEITRQAGYLQASLPTIRRQIDKIVQLLTSITPAAPRRPLSIAP